MKKFVFSIVDRYNVVDSIVRVFESDEEDCRKLFVRLVNSVWGDEVVEKEYGDRIVEKDNCCGLDLDEESYLIVKID
jgi:hypothetical protein